MNSIRHLKKLGMTLLDFQLTTVSIMLQKSFGLKLLEEIMFKTAGVENLLNEVLQRITLIRANVYSRGIIFKN
jgi:hypothetical protein